VDLDEVVADLQRDLAHAIADKDAIVEVRDLPTVYGDRGRLVQVLQNLILNALKFVPEGTQPHVEIYAQRDGAGWRISGQDNGLGIAPDHAERIFKMFRRLHTRDEFPGTGIGLAICKKVIERHGGKIWVDQAPGGGSIFNFTLPDRVNAPIVAEEALAS